MQNLKDKPKQRALSALLFNETFQEPIDDISEIDNIYYASIHAIMNNHEDNFKNQYKRISKRKVSNETSAPFLHDDFLIFILIIGVIKFGCDKQWLLDVIDKRKKISTSKSFKNLLTGNYLSKDNNQSLIMIYLDFFDKSLINDKLLIETYQFILKDSPEDDFIRIINYKSFDLILFYKQPIDNYELSRLLDFEKKFLKRIKFFSAIIYNLFLFIILFGTYGVLQVIPEVWKLKINEITLILGLFGFGLLGNVPKIRVKLTNLMTYWLGYK